MNFPTTRVQPEQISEESTDFQGFVETASAEENDYAAPKLLIAFLCALAAAGISLWYLF